MSRTHFPSKVVGTLFGIWIFENITEVTKPSYPCCKKVIQNVVTFYVLNELQLPSTMSYQCPNVFCAFVQWLYLPNGTFFLGNYIHNKLFLHFLCHSTNNELSRSIIIKVDWHAIIEEKTLGEEYDTQYV